MTTISKIDGNGQEYMTVCVNCRLDNRNICAGEKVCLENNHKKNCYSIFEIIGSRFTKELKKGREETLSQKEFEKWLVENGYTEDEQACRKARESCFNEDLRRNE